MANVVRTRSTAPSSAPAAALAPEPKKTAKADAHAHTCPRCGFIGEMQAPPPPASTSTVAARYRVIRGGTFMWRGSVCNVQTDDEIHLAHYGQAGIANMRGRGIILEPLE